MSASDGGFAEDQTSFCISPEPPMGLASTVGYSWFEVDLEPRAVDFITLHGSLLSSDPGSHPLAFGLLCKLPRAILPYSYPLHSQNVPAPRAFGMVWVHSVHFTENRPGGRW